MIKNTINVYKKNVTILYGNCNRIIYFITKNKYFRLLITKSHYKRHKPSFYYQEPHIKFPCLFFYYTIICNLLILTFGNEIQLCLATR